MKTNKLLMNLPNFCTLLNAICGILALLISVFYQNQFAIYVACIFIAIGGFFDGIDGKLARRYKVSSALGKELDSFADLITFVIAPVCVFLSMHSMNNHEHVNLLELVIIVFYIVCGVFRLARYNISERSAYFEGMPTTLSGFLMSLYIFISNYLCINWSGNFIYTCISYGIIAFLGCAMISKVKVSRL